MTDKQLIEGLKQNNNAVLKDIYLSYKDVFIAFAKRFKLNDDDAVDVFQDVVLALHENVLRGKLNELNSSLKTYLFGIGKYMIYNKLRSEKKWVTIKNNVQIEDVSLPADFEVLYNETMSTKEAQLKKAFKILGKKCKQILTLFYFQELSLEEIKVALNYSNKDVLKSQKSRCLKTLKEKMGNGR